MTPLRSLWLLLCGRTDREDPGDVVVGYAGGRGGVYLMMVAAALIELVAVDLIVPWERFGSWSWLRFMVLGLSAYGVFWVVGWWAGERSYPHLLTRHGLVLRSGPRVVARVGWNQVSSAHPRLRGTVVDGRLTLGGPGGSSNLDLELRGPLTVRPGRRRPVEVVGAISLEVDEPKSAAAAMAEHLRHLDGTKG